MADLEVQPGWPAVREIGIELARGGPNGNMNEQAKALLARTELLKNQKAEKTEIVQGHYEFGTYAEFNTAKSILPLNCTVIINERPSGTQIWGQGTNRWNGIALVKSEFDPEAKSIAYTESRIDFVSSIPVTNKFIKELYITGWNGTDELYLMTFNDNDNAKVTFRIHNKTTNKLVLYTYQKSQGQQIYPLETAGDATGSGFGGYVVVDWNAYTTAINAQGAYTYKVSKKALNLVNCPFIKEYIDVSSLVTSVLTNTNDISVLKQADAAIFSRLDFVTGLPETNQFIKELYITGWNGTDEIYLMGFTNADNSKVTFTFKNKTANRNVIYTYQKVTGQQIYPLETAGDATGSGFRGYVVVDWNAYTTAINAQGAYTYKVSKKALNLVNCPFIKEYLDLIPINAAITANTNDVNLLKQSNTYHNTLLSSATHTQTKLINNLILNIKLLNGYKSGFNYFINNIELLANAIRVNIKYFDPANPETANTWASYNITIAKGSMLVETYELKYESYRWLITVDWNYFPQLTAAIGGGSLTATPLNTERLFEKDTTYLLRSQPNFYKVGNAFKDGQSKLNHIFANAIFSASGDANYSYTVEKVADGTRVVLSNVNANVNRRFRFAFNPFYVRIPDNYFVYLKYTINSASGATSQVMSVSLSRSKTISTSSFFDNIVNGKTYEEVRKMEGDLTGAVYTDGSLFFDFWSASNSAAGVVFDITIHDFRLLYNYAQDPIFINKERKEVEQLVRALGYFEDEVTIPKFVDTALGTQNINKGLEMQSLGDSTSVMVMWQERLAQMKGWHFNRTMAINGLNGGYPTALGGSWCEPIISNLGATGNAGQNHYTRSNAIASYNINVLFVLSSYNGQHPGKAWQSGGQLVKADHGINDAAYLGTEVNLITNPTADFPSFAASYYGMLEKIMTANPNTRIILLTLYLFNASASDLNNVLLKNAVIRKAAEKYSLQLIDLEKISGINSFTANTLSFDGGVHINQKGGDRLAQVIGGVV